MYDPGAFIETYSFLFRNAVQYIFATPNDVDLCSIFLQSLCYHKADAYIFRY